jgi:hypothetical protein
MIKNAADFCGAAGDHMTFLALTGNDAGALRLFQRHVAEAFDGADPSREYRFAVDSYLTIATIARRKKRAKLRLPKLNDVIADGDYVLEELAGGLERLALELGERFDRRNGNDAYVRGVRESLKWQRFAVK